MQPHTKKEVAHFSSYSAHKVYISLAAAILNFDVMSQLSIGNFVLPRCSRTQKREFACCLFLKLSSPPCLHICIYILRWPFWILTRQPNFRKEHFLHLDAATHQNRSQNLIYTSRCSLKIFTHGGYFQFPIFAQK